MKFTKILFISISILIVFINYSCQRKLKSESSTATTRFRVESKNMAEFSKRFYSKLAAKKKEEEKEKKEKKDDNEKGEDKGPKPIENSSWIGVGYNIVYGNPIIAPQNGKLVDGGFTTSIFEQTFTKGNKTPDGTYNFPDGWEVQPAQVCKTNFSSQTMKSVASLTSSMEASLGGSVGGLWGTFSFSANAEYKQMSSAMQSEDKLYISNTATCTIYRAVINRYDPPNFTKNFLSGLENLKDKKYDETNKEAFYTFIKTFGTHYIYDMMMGSRYTYVMETTNSAMNEMKTQNINVSAEAKYEAATSIDVKASYKKDLNSTSTFEKSITNKFVTSIGAPMPASMEMNDWLGGTNSVPMPVSYSIKSLTSLLKTKSVVSRLTQAGFNSTSISENLQKAYDGYCKYLVDSKVIVSCDKTVTATIEEKYTDFAELPSIFELDRHKIECAPNSAINFFEVIKGDKQMRYHYKCVKSENISNDCISRQTPPYVYEGNTNSLKGDNGDIFNLQYHPITCEAGKVIHSFVASRNKNSFFYTYSCCAAKLKNCYKITNNSTEMADKIGSSEDIIIALKDQVVDAKNKNVLSSFKFDSSLSTNGKRINAYRYDSCVLSN